MLDDSKGQAWGSRSAGALRSCTEVDSGSRARARVREALLSLRFLWSKLSCTSAALLVDETRGHDEPAGKEETKATDNVSRPTVLVVEDNEPNMRLASDLLEEAGYAVLQASDCGRRNTAWLLARVPALILMDISLPGMDGLAATRILKQDPRTCDIPVVAFTAHAMKGDRDKALAAGCDGYLPKPIDKSTFLATITRLLSLRSSWRFLSPCGSVQGFR